VLFFIVFIICYLPSCSIGGDIEAWRKKAAEANFPKNFTYIALTSGIEMAWIPAGSFTMGSNNSQDWNASPPHTVTLSAGFHMGKYQVTQEQYQAVMGSNPSSFSSNPASGEVQRRRPVERVSWYNAIVFCNRLSVADGLTPAYEMQTAADTGVWSTDTATWGTVPTDWSDPQRTRWDAVRVVASSTGYRLPTEAQWEYAAKGGNEMPGRFTYSGSNNVNNVAWYLGNSNNRTHEVGKKVPNWLGIYDMSGNVWEWCWDWWGSYTGTAKTNPTGSSSGTYRVFRGGSWYDSAEGTRSANRSYNSPNPGYIIVGFRLARP